MRTVANSSSYPTRSGGVRLVVVHTAETPCEEGRAYNIAAYLANPAVRASAHYVVDPGETVAQVPEEGTAWAAPGANSDGIQIEQAAYAGYSADDWQGENQQRMLRTQLAPLVAGICRRWDLPAVWLSAADLLAGKAGVTDHNTVNEAYRASDHWDCGPSFPAGLLMELVRAELGDTADGGAIEGEEQFMLQHFLRVTEGELKDTVYARYTTGALVPIAPEEFDTDGGKVPVKNTTTAGLRMALKVG